MATRVSVPTESVLRVVRPGEEVSAGLYVVVWETDLANVIDRSGAVFALDEWRGKPNNVRRCYRTVVYRAQDPLDAYVQALKEQTDA